MSLWQNKQKFFSNDDWLHSSMCLWKFLMQFNFEQLLHLNLFPYFKNVLPHRFLQKYLALFFSKFCINFFFHFFSIFSRNSSSLLKPNPDQSNFVVDNIFLINSILIFVLLSKLRFSWFSFCLKVSISVEFVSKQLWNNDIALLLFFSMALMLSPNETLCLIDFASPSNWHLISLNLL